MLIDAEVMLLEFVEYSPEDVCLFAKKKGGALLRLVCIFFLRVINDNRIMPTVQEPQIYFPLDSVNAV